MTPESSAATSRFRFFFGFFTLLIPGSIATAQQPALTLAEAWAKAEARSDQLIIAGARQEHARGNALELGSIRRPKLSAFTSYDRTLRSEFEGFGGFASDSATPSNEESAEIPFGSAHTYRAGLTVSYTVFSGGRGLAQSRAAASTRRAADLGFTSSVAQLRLDVAEAYYEAMLAHRLHRIAEWTLEQAESTYNRVSIVAGAGRAPEFDLVRAKAARDRQRPVVIQREAERDVAVLRLRQLLQVPSSSDVTLPADILATLPAPIAFDNATGVARNGIARRTAVREAAESVARGEQMLAASQSGRLPAVTLTSTYERVAYPLSGNPSWNNSRANWTVGARIEHSVLNGGRQNGSDAMARADLDAARARLRLTEQLAELDTQSSIARLTAAEATLIATEASVAEAARAYEIAMLRYREGVSIQLELSDARLGLEQARADQAKAARDVSIERIRATLLPDLPLGADGSAIAQRSTASRSVSQ